eukprot:gene12994-5358_t
MGKIEANSHLQAVGSCARMQICPDELDKNVNEHQRRTAQPSPAQPSGYGGCGAAKHSVNTFNDEGKLMDIWMFRDPMDFEREMLTTA